jgi:dTDP-4-dehydrorhamnose 3,5-epimerase
VAQCNISFNERRGTLRGLHYQVPPHAEVKVIRCTSGAVFDVIVDLREGSETYTRWIGVELSAENRRMLYVPEGFAHGYLTLADETETFYQVSMPYAPDAERGARWDDPAFGIEWPQAGELVISEKDRRWPDFHPAAGS